MYSLEQFQIDLTALTEAETPLSYELDDRFFKSLDDAEVKSGSLHVSGSIRKASGLYELQLDISGTIQLPCDRCLEMMTLPIATELRETVKGDTYDAAWPIYESIALAVPIQHVHQPGDCNVAMSEKLKEFSAARSSDADAQTPIDPRWEALSRLKIEN